MNNDEATSELTRLYPRLRRTALRYLDAGEAEDIVQDAATRIWTLRHTLQIPIDGFALILVRNLSIDHCRRKRFNERIEDVDVSQTGEGAGEETLTRMMDIVNALPDLQQTILRLRHMQGMDLKDIARLLNCTETSLRMALSRARKTVREKYLAQNKH